MDEEALTIFNDFVIKYSDQRKNKRSEIFPMAYKNAAKRIMKQSGWNMTTTIYAVIGVFAIAFLIYQYRKKPSAETQDKQ